MKGNLMKMRAIPVMFVLMAAGGCAERAAIDSSTKLNFVQAKQNAQMSIGGRTVYVQGGEKYPSVQLDDGRRVVILDKYTSNDPFLLFANLSQTSGSVLDADGCTTKEYVSVNSAGVTIEKSALLNVTTTGICFDA